VAWFTAVLEPEPKRLLGLAHVAPVHHYGAVAASLALVYAGLIHGLTEGDFDELGGDVFGYQAGLHQ
jgi:fructose-1,6-bisphosphatase/inositol monophosphatase family enzyme